jgi:DNA-3-methyladenine glycosylase
MLLVHETEEGASIGRVVETEAYFGPGDPASHAHRGPTPRSSIMFGTPGIAYVYFSYGMYDLLNVVTEREGSAGAVLIRALAPLEGVELMARRRARWAAQRDRSLPRGAGDAWIASGPGKLTIAMGIDLSDNGRDLTRGLPLCVSGGTPVPDEDIRASTRVGINAGQEYDLRFYVAGDPNVSRAERPAAAATGDIT